MTPSRLFALCLAVVAVGACSDDDELGAPAPVGSLRFIHAVGDTGSMDFRVVDIVGDAPQFLSNLFRSFTPYQAVTAGTRRIRVFMTPSQTDTIVGAPLIWDTTLAFTAGTNYTILMTGLARTGATPALQLIQTADDAPVPPAGSFALRVVHAAGSLAPYTTGPIDGWAVARGSAALSGTPTFSNVAPGGVTAYANVPVGTLRMAWTAAGTTAPILFQSNMPPGVAGTPSANPIGGTAVEGSAVTAILTLRAEPGSTAPHFAAQLPFTSLASVGTTVTAVTPVPHGLTNGDTVTVNGAIQPAYNGTFLVTVVDPTTFTYTASGTPPTPSATNYPFWFRTRFASAFNGRPVDSLTAAGTTGRMVTRTAHGLATNDIVTISGAGQAAYNGSFAVTVVNATTFTYTTNGAPATSPATGATVYRPGDLDFTTPNEIFVVDRRPAMTVP